MIVVNFGGGTNSTGLLVGAVERGLRPDIVVFADTGSEMPHTYAHLEIERRAVTRSALRAEPTTIKGLGRSHFAWADVVKGLPVVQGPSEVACGCYDGDE